MSTVYAIAYIPAADLASAEAAVAPYLLSPNSPGVNTFSVPLSPTGAAPPTAYGCCAPVTEIDPATGQPATILAAIPALIAQFPGSAYQIVDVGSYQYGRDWIGWLAGQGLVPIATQGM